MSTNLNQTHTGITCHTPGPLEHIKIRPDHSPAKLSTLKVKECAIKGLDAGCGDSASVLYVSGQDRDKQKIGRKVILRGVY